MADIDIFSIEPHQVSRDMRGYSVFFYGDPKSGKTTTASKFPKSLLLGFEKGWNTLAGVKAQSINSWSDFRKVLRQLKDPRAHDIYETIIIDTVDIAYDYAENYICANAGVDAIGDIGYGKGYTMVAKEFDSALRSIVQMDYGLVLISHAVDKTFTDESGKEYNQIVPTLGSKPRNIVSRMSDIIGYTRSIEIDGVNTVKMFMRGTPRFVAGSRFKYTPDYIDFTYNDLVNAINDAIDKQAAEDGQEFFTNSRQNLHSGVASAPDFDNLMEEFKTIVANIPGSADPKCETEEGQKFKEYWMPRIIEITDRYLGKGKKVNQCTRDQVEALDLIVTELKDLTHIQ